MKNKLDRNFFVARGKEGSNKRWAKRLLLIEKLRGFGGEQPNYTKWTTRQLQVLLKVWEKEN